MQQTLPGNRLSAAPNPSSPAPVSPSPAGRSNPFNTLGRIGKNKKQQEEVAKLDAEGKQAFEQPSGSTKTVPDGFYKLSEGEERSMIEPASRDKEDVKKLIEILLNWINNELMNQRILVRDIEEDLYDGQVLQKLVEKFTNEEIKHPEITLSEIGQKQRLKLVLQKVESEMKVTPQWARRRWSADRIHSRDMVAILHLLVAMVRHFAPNIRLPSRVQLGVLLVKMTHGSLIPRTETVDITEDKDSGPNSGSQQRDVIDALFERAPESVAMLEDTLMTFANKHLKPLDIHVENLVSDFEDGVLLILLMGSLEGYFVPLYHYNSSAPNEAQKVANVNLAFELMKACGLPKSKDTPEDIVHGEKRAILRLLYSVFHRYEIATE